MRFDTAVGCFPSVQLKHDSGQFVPRQLSQAIGEDKTNRIISDHTGFQHILVHSVCLLYTHVSIIQKFRWAQDLADYILP
jgi:hypothetical protein